MQKITQFFAKLRWNFVDLRMLYDISVGNYSRRIFGNKRIYTLLFTNEESRVYLYAIAVTSSVLRWARKPRVRAYRFFDFILNTRSLSPRVWLSTLSDTFFAAAPTLSPEPSSRVVRSAWTFILPSISACWRSTTILSPTFTVYCLPPISTIASIRKLWKIQITARFYRKIHFWQIYMPLFWYK